MGLQHGGAGNQINTSSVPKGPNKIDSNSANHEPISNAVDVNLLELLGDNIPDKEDLSSDDQEHSEGSSGGQHSDNPGGQHSDNQGTKNCPKGDLLGQSILETGESYEAYQKGFETVLASEYAENTALKARMEASEKAVEEAQGKVPKMPKIPDPSDSNYDEEMDKYNQYLGAQNRAKDAIETSMYEQSQCKNKVDTSSEQMQVAMSGAGNLPDKEQQELAVLKGMIHSTTKMAQKN